VRAFVGVVLAREMAPDTTTLLRFRHLLETNELTQRMFVAINTTLTEKDLLMRLGTTLTRRSSTRAVVDQGYRTQAR
jgi:IS5 family transposase